MPGLIEKVGLYDEDGSNLPRFGTEGGIEVG